MKSCSVNHLQSKISINVCKSKFWRKIKRAPKQNYFKKCHFGGRNYGIWLKNDKPLMESYSLTHFQSKSYTNLCESEFQSKTKPNTKNFFFLKDSISEAEMMEFGRKKINLVWSLAHWPIYNQKATKIFVNLNSSAK